jgi:putative addiction module component (TIGR02574 family)
MKTATLKKEIYHAIDNTKDNEILEAVYTILRRTIVEEEEPTELTTTQKKELDKRLADHKAGKLKYYTIDEVRKAVFKAIKK